MTERRVCPPAPAPLEEYATSFDPLFDAVAQRRGFRDYVQGLLLPRERTKTLTALAGTEPVVGAQDPPAQRLQFFLSESSWDAATINDRRVELAVGDPATMPHDDGALIIDETGDPKDGTKTAHVGRQYLGSVGKIDNGIVAVSSLWADERVYYPLHVQPYTPAARLPLGKKDPAFRTKPQIAVALVDAALAAGVCFRAVVADCGYGENATFEEALDLSGLPYVLGLKPSTGVWALAPPHTPEDAARSLRWGDPAAPGDWTRITRRFRDGHTEPWWAADLRYGPFGPDRRLRVVVATADPATLPAQSTWYLLTNLPHPDAPHAAESPLAPADLAEVVRLYGLRTWVEQGYKQVKHELGWADFQVRSDRAIRRHWALVCAAFSFCWWHWFRTEAGGAPLTATAGAPAPREATAAAPGAGQHPPPAAPARGRGGKSGRRAKAAHPARPVVAHRVAPRPGLARRLELPAALLASVVRSAPAAAPAGAPGRSRRRSAPQPLPPTLTKYG